MAGLRTLVLTCVSGLSLATALPAFAVVDYPGDASDASTATHGGSVGTAGVTPAAPGQPVDVPNVVIIQHTGGASGGAPYPAGSFNAGTLPSNQSGVDRSLDRSHDFSQKLNNPINPSDAQTIVVVPK
jgi:hypothetical protein